ncbi:MAG: hypothetical protein ABFD83_08045 [Armatimonadota bacterium]
MSKIVTSFPQHKNCCRSNSSACHSQLDWESRNLRSDESFGVWISAFAGMTQTYFALVWDATNTTRLVYMLRELTLVLFDEQDSNVIPAAYKKPGFLVESRGKAFGGGLGAKPPY